MLKAQVYYFPESQFSFGHIAVKVIFPEDDIPSSTMGCDLALLSLKEGENLHEEIFEDCKRKYLPILIKQNNQFSLYGYKDGDWQITKLDNLSDHELKTLQGLSFAEGLSDKKSYHLEWSPISMENKIIPNPNLESPLLDIVKKGHPHIKKNEFFFDWGASYDFQKDCQNRGKPICIDFPEINKSFYDFFSIIERPNVYPYDYPNRSSDMSSPHYHYFKNNCAHATLQILHAAGYINKKPPFTFALTPYLAARQVCKVARYSQALFRKQIIESLANSEKRNDTIHINQLILESLKRVQHELKIGRTPINKLRKKELELLSNIKYNGSTESIEKLLHAAERVSKTTAKELNQCISILPSGAQLKMFIERLNVAALKLEKRNYTQDAKCGRELATALTQQLTEFKNTTINHETFVKNCSNLIDENRPILEKHRGHKRILGNIALAIMGLVAFYLIAIGINKAVRGNFLFFNDTNLSRISKDIKKEILKYPPPK